MKIQLICMKYPCNGCVIVQGLIREVIEKAVAMRDVEYEEVILQHPNAVFSVEGLEVEKLPAVLLNGEQITAGNLISTKQLLYLIDNY